MSRRVNPVTGFTGAAPTASSAAEMMAAASRTAAGELVGGPLVGATEVGALLAGEAEPDGPRVGEAGADGLLA